MMKRKKCQVCRRAHEEDGMLCELCAENLATKVADHNAAAEQKRQAKLDKLATKRAEKKTRPKKTTPAPAPSDEEGAIDLTVQTKRPLRRTSEMPADEAEADFKASQAVATPVGYEVDELEEEEDEEDEEVEPEPTDADEPKQTQRSAKRGVRMIGGIVAKLTETELPWDSWGIGPDVRTGVQFLRKALEKLQTRPMETKVKLPPGTKVRVKGPDAEFYAGEVLTVKERKGVKTIIVGANRPPTPIATKFLEVV